MRRSIALSFALATFFAASGAGADAVIVKRPQAQLADAVIVKRPQIQAA